MHQGAPRFADLVASDVAAWSRQWSPGAGSGVVAGARLLWGQVGFRATVLYRLSHALHSRGIRALPGSVARLNLMLHGLDIPAAVAIGPGLYIPHPVGTVVMAQRIGAGAALISCVTIGMRNEHAFPVIGDRVFVGAGARVLGGITIGDDVMIGANAVVLSDVPNGCVAVGVPAVVRVRSGEPAR